MSDIHALSGAYAIDALDDIERAQFERHLARCAECRAEVESLREASAMLAETAAVEPPADLRSRLLADIRTVRPLPPVTQPPAVPVDAGEATGDPAHGPGEVPAAAATRPPGPADPPADGTADRPADRPADGTADRPAEEPGAAA